MPFIQGKTNTGGALERAQQVLAEGRPSVPKIILLITDGDATDKERLDAQIQKLKQVSNYLLVIYFAHNLFCPKNGHFPTRC